MVSIYWLKCFVGLGNLEARLISIVKMFIEDIGDISRVSINFISGWTFD